MRCGVHGLVAGPDGSCALCRRGEPEPRPEKRISPIGILLGLVAVLCVAAIGYTALRRAMAPAEPTLTAESSTPTQEPAASTEPNPELAAEPENEAREPEPNPDPAPAPDPFRDPTAATDPPGAAPSPALSVQALAATTAGTAAPTASAPPSPVQQPGRIAAAEQLRAAMQRVPVTLYTTTWCKHCERARVFMRANSIPFTEHDVEANDSAARAQKALNPRGGVPTINIDGQVLVGFNEASVVQALANAAQRRMR